MPGSAIDNQIINYDYPFTLKNLLTIVIIVKLIIFLSIFLAYFVLPFNEKLYHASFVYPPDEEANIFTTFKTWDGHHYLFLAENGYPDKVINSTAFYPLYPFTIRVVGFIFLGNTLAAGLLISNLCSVIAIAYFYLLVKRMYGDKIAFIASLFMVSFITFFYTSIAYTEGLFLLLLTAFFYYLYEKKFYPCLLLGILIPLTRPTGILVILFAFHASITK